GAQGNRCGDQRRRPQRLPARDPGRHRNGDPPGIRWAGARPRRRSAGRRRAAFVRVHHALDRQGLSGEAPLGSLRLTPLRGALVVVVALVAQIAIVADLRVVGAVGDLMLLVTVAAALTGGPDRGATYGFVCGLAFDLVLDSPFGLSALTYAVVGYGVGVVCGGLFRPTGWWPLAGGRVAASLAHGLCHGSLRRH